MKHYMIVDIGTGNSRVALVREDGALICVKTFENIYYIDEAYEDAQYFDPSFWKRNILGLCREIIHMYPNITIDAISSSGAEKVLSSSTGNRKTSMDFPILITGEERGWQRYRRMGFMRKRGAGLRRIFLPLSLWAYQSAEKKFSIRYKPLQA